METDQSSRENLDQGNPDEQVVSQGRSYECTFCKRGFSNAQALGGHMNIHRKDRLKLKKFSDEPQQSLDIPKPAPSFSLIATAPPLPSLEAKSTSSEGRSSSVICPRIPGQESEATKRGKTHVAEIQQLCLFVDDSLSNNLQKPGIQVHGSSESTGHGLSASQGFSGCELDLELRLGPEPRESSKTSGNRKFF